jgi:uncharacterized protein (TIGR02300 family)
VASERPSRAFNINASTELRGTNLAKAALGEKQVCPNCTAKFYDLGRRPASCPKCATVFDPHEEGVRARRSRSRAAAFDSASEDEEEEVEAKETKAEGDDEAVEPDTPEIDSEAADDPVSTDDEDAETPSGDDLPPGFSEADPELEAEASDDDDVPMLDDEEEFPEDEIGELPADDEEESR